MFNLDPGKMIVIAVVAIILLGPDKLPQFARQVGGAWRTFSDFRHRMESEVRSSMPDLPPTHEIARLARSPAALLNHLSKLPSEDDAAPDGSPESTAAPAADGVGEGAADGAASGGDARGETGSGGDGTGGVGGADEWAGDGEGTETATPASNGRPAFAPQPADAAVPVDPTLN